MFAYKGTYLCQDLLYDKAKTGNSLGFFPVPFLSYINTFYKKSRLNNTFYHGHIVNFILSLGHSRIGLLWHIIYLTTPTINIIKKQKKVSYLTNIPIRIGSKKRLSLCHKLWFSNPHIFATQDYRPLIFQTINSVSSNSAIYQMVTPSGCTNIRSRIFQTLINWSIRILKFEILKIYDIGL